MMAKPLHKYRVNVYWIDEDANNVRRLIGTWEGEAKDEDDARSKACDEVWPNHLDAAAAYDVDDKGTEDEDEDEDEDIAGGAVCT